eukprot:Nitzschia sp. Nitz4//scaffold102_size76354//54677//55708//NITZ4_005638-RA/size76354-processed-gene-0.25-mRNA-1//1//CDS//3329532267//103//frame0
MATVSIVRVGPSEDNVCAKLLRTALVDYFEESAKTDSSYSGDSSRLTIANKYFRAKVALEDIQSPVPPSEPSKEDGIILVFDSLHSNPDRTVSESAAVHFDALDGAHEQAGDGELLRLCVGVSLTPLSSQEIRGANADQEYSRRILWCLDRGYEYVEADLSKEGLAKGHEERDKEGFARIVEAIQGTVWSSAIMAKAKTKELQTSYEEANAQLNTEFEDKEEENPYIPPNPSLLASYVPSEPPKDLQDVILSPDDVGPEEMAALRKDMETENLFDRMEGVIRQASQIREASKAGTMTDDERRDKASEAAMALVNLMSQFGMDDDDEDCLDSSDDDSGIVADES